MSINGEIQYITQPQIDKKKWDACIAAASNGLIYGFSFYLDCMAKQWDALVLNDYEAVMPLTWNKKYGIYYLYQPFLCASLGVFGKSVTAVLTESFLLTIPGKFRYIDISLNHGNLFKIEIAGLYERKNYILHLQEPYTVLYSRFSENVKRNIKKSLQNKCSITTVPFADVLQLAKHQLNQVLSVSNADFTRFSLLYNYLQEKNATAVYGITATDGRLLSSCVFFFWQKRAYYILVGNDAGSKQTGASHALINAFIKDHAEKDIMLDFEGSDVPGLALFYKSFGATEEKYAAVQHNRLPLLFRWIKS